ncbi:hypothetical protein P4V41_20505 [Fictibacillus nanhaiensis]|uniref:hypothetical protein n=1 Tax=Fictibacillus nanhaiensis TaxID=742169 RepID=UPI002E23DF0D|nr:hypothetical protein [Fictibacillus nanhaiensis]
MKFLKIILVMSLTMTLFVSTSAGLASASTITIEEEQVQVEDLAEKLEYLFEEAALTDISGNVIGFDFEKVEEKYGTSPELEQLKLEMTAKPQVVDKNGPQKSAAVDRCINKKIKNNIGEFLTLQFISTVVTYIVEKKYEKAAKKLIAAGVRGNAISLAVQLGYYYTTCVYQEHGW